jgi:hypothetical protein
MRAKLPGESLHRLEIWLLTLVTTALILWVTVKGFPYYILSLDQKPFSPLHAEFRSSGTIGLRIGILSVVMFAILFLYPLRKRWRWLASIGSTRRWLNFHVFFGIATPIVVTFHTGFRFHGVAGLAYWTMMAVALSGFVGRYVYAKIPRSISAVELSMGEMQAQSAELAARLNENTVFSMEDFGPLLNVPDTKEVRSMGLLRTLWTMIRLDVARPFQVSRLRRRVLHGTERITTLGGLLPSRHEDMETIVSNVRRQSRLRVTVAFLDRTERLFHLWHVVHRPFSISFVALLVVHVGVVLSVGL